MRTASFLHMLLNAVIGEESKIAVPAPLLMSPFWYACLIGLREAQGIGLLAQEQWSFQLLFYFCPFSSSSAFWKQLSLKRLLFMIVFTAPLFFFGADRLKQIP